MNRQMSKWLCEVEGRIKLPSGKIRRCNRMFDGAGDVYSSAREALSKRRDKGSPWHGKTVMVTTPLGQRVIVEIF